MAKHNNTSTPGVGISANSKKQPDYAKVIPAFTSIITTLETHSVKPTPWHIEEASRVIKNLVELKDPLVVVIISSFEKVITAGDLGQAYGMLDTFVRPQTSLLHSNSPCPPIFMQRNNLLVDGVNANLAEHTADPNFWWQPVTNPVAYAFANAINDLKASCSIGHGVDFCNIKNKI